jgi:hypothetical protein
MVVRIGLKYERICFGLKHSILIETELKAVWILEFENDYLVLAGI